MLRKTIIVLSVLSFTLLTGCATTGGDHRDPIEGLNRAVYQLNDGLDRAIFKPVAQGYRAVVPEPVDKGVTNFFGNLEDVITVFNDLLQFKFARGGRDAARVLVNSTIGILGLIDVATGMGLEKHDEDFGQTLGHWGVGPGPYLMLPLWGPSSLRDLTGKFIDAGAFDPMTGEALDPVYNVDHVPTRNTLRLIEGLDTRADLLGASNILEEAALDKYNFIKESYFQKREHDVNDGQLAFPE